MPNNKIIIKNNAKYLKSWQTIIYTVYVGKRPLRDRPLVWKLNVYFGLLFWKFDLRGVGAHAVCPHGYSSG